MTIQDGNLNKWGETASSMAPSMGKRCFLSAVFIECEVPGSKRRAVYITGLGRSGTGSINPA